MVLIASFTVFAVAAFPALVLMAVWTAVTVLRILRPEQPLPFFADPVAERHEATASGVSVPVGFREIREDVQVLARTLALPYDYHAAGSSHHVPEPWLDDLHRRRN